MDRQTGQKQLLDAFMALQQSSQKRAPKPKEPEPQRKPHVRLTPEDKRKVLDLLLSGEKPEKVASKYRISLSTASNIKRQYEQFITFVKAMSPGEAQTKGPEDALLAAPKGSKANA